MKEKIRECLGKVPKWVRGVVACAVIIAVTVVVDYFIQDYMYKSRYKIIKDDFSHVFQIDGFEQKDKELILTGWVFELEVDSVDNDFEVILYDYNNDKEYYMEVEDVVRKDVNEYFLCEYDYSKVGFVASAKLSKLDLEEINYEILIRPKNVRKAYKTGTYISNEKMIYTEPEDFVELDVEGTDLEAIVNEGILRVYRPDVGMYVYQYEGKLYWIADENYEMEVDGSTFVEYQLITTQNDKLPAERLARNWLFDNIGFYFENNEIINTSNYRVTVSELPTEYSIRRIETGYYVGGWHWIQHFRPWYEFTSQ